MIRIELQVEVSYQVEARGADFIFNVHAAHTPHHTASSERLELSQPIESRVHVDPMTGTRYLRLRARPVRCGCTTPRRWIWPTTSPTRRNLPRCPFSGCRRR
jgi:hypothetical protein